ncbi:hypothetical protein LJC08_02720 [Methanimicrococcus sp. OttesenSCG-928-J09]|nr:hypothetical protein [Methanimicrococcus sp. OttesenSCG-928-J09]
MKNDMEKGLIFFILFCKIDAARACVAAGSRNGNGSGKVAAGSTRSAGAYNKVK